MSEKSPLRQGIRVLERLRSLFFFLPLNSLVMYMIESILVKDLKVGDIIKLDSTLYVRSLDTFWEGISSLRMPGIECLVYEVLDSQVNCWILPTSQRRLLLPRHSPKSI